MRGPYGTLTDIIDAVRPCWVIFGFSWSRTYCVTLTMSQSCLWGAKSIRQDAGKAMNAADTPDRIIRINTVLERTGLSRSTLYRKVQDGTFPKQVRIAARCVGWRESAVGDWMRNPMFYGAGDSPLSS